ncbi:MAG: NUDIX hydrolase [Thermoplasmata archaeon]
MNGRPKHLLIELPTADEIDDLAITSPEFEVRKFEFHMSGKRADLNYAPCKGQIVVVVRGRRGTALVRKSGSEKWSLPSSRIAVSEDSIQAAKRVAMEDLGLSLRRLELAGIYDVVWHYSDVSIKRLHIIYAAETDDEECKPANHEEIAEGKFFSDIAEDILTDELTRSAVSDCSAK